MHRRALFILVPVVLVPIALVSTPAMAQIAGGATGEAPPDAKAIVTAPKGPAVPPPDTDKPEDHTMASLAAGGQAATGNSRLVAGTMNGAFDMRRGQNGFGFSILGNYGEALESPAPKISTNTTTHVTTYSYPNGTAPSMQETAENIQGRIRYDRYVSQSTSFFGIVTGRHDKFQGLQFRLNLDPGIKHIFVGGKAYSFWGELGYDFQYDNRYADQLQPTDPTTGLDIGGPLPQTATDHSVRAFIGFRDAFSKEVSLTTGVEFLQSFIHVDNTRVNVDALFAAKVAGGLSLGLGFGLRYDNDPLPGKVNTDTTTTINLIYAFADTPKKPKPPTCPCEPAAGAENKPLPDAPPPVLPPALQPAPPVVQPAPVSSPTPAVVEPTASGSQPPPPAPPPPPAQPPEVH